MAKAFQSLTLAAILAFLAGEQTEAAAVVHDTASKYVTAIAAKRLGGSPDFVELRDVKQKIFLEIYRSAPKFSKELNRNNPSNHFRLWLGKVARNVCEQFRREAKRCKLFVYLPYPDRVPHQRAVEPLNRLLDLERDQAVQITLMRLARRNPLGAIALELQFMEGWPPADVAHFLNLSRDVSYKRTHSAKQQFAELYLRLDANREN